MEISKASNGLSSHESGSIKSRKLGLKALIFISVHAGLLTLGILGILPTFSDSKDMVDTLAWLSKSIFIGGIGAVAWFLIILNLFRNSSWVCWVLADLVLCGIVGFITSSIYITREANIQFSQPPAQIFSLPVIIKVCQLNCKIRCGRRCTRRSYYTYATDAECSPESRESIMQQKQKTDPICAVNAWFEYTLSVQHWREQPYYTFSPNASLFDSVNIGTLLNVPVNEGALGLEWVDSEQIQKR